MMATAENNEYHFSGIPAKLERVRAYQENESALEQGFEYRLASWSDLRKIGVSAANCVHIAF